MASYLDHPLPLAVTMGEPGGIGGEILLKAWDELSSSPPFLFAIDDTYRLQSIAEQLGIDVTFTDFLPSNTPYFPGPRALPVLHSPLAASQTPGQLAPQNANATILSIRKAVEMTRAGKAAAVVTNPIQKSALYEAGFQFPGHTEYLASLITPNPQPVMMLACDQLRVVPVTIHVSLQEALQTLSTDIIIEQSIITDAALRRDFGIKTPRLAIAGLNPHAGEDGAMGHEESTIITPAVEALQRQGIQATGPYSPDTLFSARARPTYDVAICMYHDQALIPIKTLDFDGGVNVTLGLDFIRTSPDHGTALDIAGTGKASAKSLVAAIRMAEQMVKHRRNYETLNNE